MYSKAEAKKLREDFWISFGKSFPRKWTLYDTKIKDFSFKFSFDTRKARVLLAVEDPDEEMRSLYYNKLLSLKTILQEEYLSNAIFEEHFFLENGKEISCVYVELQGVTIHNKNTWQQTMEFLINQCRSLKPFGKNIKISFKKKNNLVYMKKRTILNLLLILFVLSFFITPLGYESKILLQRIFASSVDIIPADKAQKIDFSWQLKDRNDVQFNYSQTEGKKPSFVYFFSSWRGISIADLYAVEKLYDVYKDKVDFYIITNEKPEPVEEMMQKRNFHFKVTYLIIGEKMPFDPEKIPAGYIVDKNGLVRAQKEGIARWNSDAVHELLDTLIK